MKNRLLTILVGLSLFVPVLFERLSRGNESLLYPFPALVIIPMFLDLYSAAFAVPVVLFFVWNPRLFRGESAVPKRSYILLMVTTLADAFWFVDGLKYGLRFQGASYTHGVLFLNIVWIAVLWLMFVYAWKSKPSFATNLLVHWWLFAWLAWYALPFMGELP
jgi:hypothetical protein